MKTTFLQLSVLVALVMGLVSFSACGDDAPTPGASCSVAINSFNLGTTNFNSGASISGSISLDETTSLDATDLRGMTTLYISSDTSYDSGDTQLAAFTAAPIENGTQTTIIFDQIEIPSINSGDYYIIAQVHSQPCGNGETITATATAQSVTVN